jgi:MinD-like ATPase involved in chromosome partitioning or flagellar assembly
VNAPLGVVLGLAPLEEEAIEEALYGGELHVLASGADAAEVVRLAAARAPDLVLISAGLPGLDRALVERLRAIGPRLAGVALDEQAHRSLRRVGIDPVVGAPLELGALRAVAYGLNQAGEATASSAPTGPVAVPEWEGDAYGAPGSTVAVVGTRGAPGASELAASFAALVGRVHDVILADFDGDGGELALRFGVDVREGSLVALVRALGENESDLPALLPHWVSAASGGWPAVLPGLVDAQLELRDHASPELGGRLVRLLAQYAQLLVCDVGHRLRGGDGGDRALELHRSAVASADMVIVVVGARADQLRAGVRQIDLLLGDLGVAAESLRVVVNGQPGIRHPSAESSYRPFALALAGRGLVVDAVLPYDSRAHRAARRRSLPMALATSRGRYGRVVESLVGALLLPTLPQPAARKRRLRISGVRRGGPQVIEEVALPWRG